MSSIDIDKEVKLLVSDRDFTIATIAPPTVIAVEEEKVETEGHQNIDWPQAGDTPHLAQCGSCNFSVPPRASFKRCWMTPNSQHAGTSWILQASRPQ